MERNKGITGKQEADKEMDMGFLWQINFQGSWVSLLKASRSGPLLTKFSFTTFPHVKLIKFQSVAKRKQKQWKDGHVFKTS